MAKDKVTVTVAPEVLADTDNDAAEEQMNRSEYVEKVLRDEHYRRLIARATPSPLPADVEAEIRQVFDWQNGHAA